MRTLDTDYPETIKEAAIEWRLLILDGELSQLEQQAFDAWISEDVRHAEAYEHAAVIWAALGTVRPETLNLAHEGTRKSGFLQQVVTALRPDGVFGRRAIVLGALGVLTICFAALFLWVGRPTDPASSLIVTTYETQKGETKSVFLADATEVTLGAGSAIEVKMSDALRRVHLAKGAATFDVSPDIDRPFVVEAEALSVTVTGTVFDVRNNGGVVRLSVAEGAVEAAHPGVTARTPAGAVRRRKLVAGERVRATADEGLGSVEAFEVGDFAAWREDRLGYSGASLKELIADANRYSESEIVLDRLSAELERARITVSFNGKEIDSLLALLPDIFAVEVFEADDGTIRVRETRP